MKENFTGKKVEDVELVDIEGDTTHLQDVIKDDLLLVVDVWSLVRTIGRIHC